MYQDIGDSSGWPSANDRFPPVGRLLLIVGGDRDRRLWGASCSSERRLPFVTALIRIPGRNPSAM
jgi:hypothetical protein